MGSMDFNCYKQLLKALDTHNFRRVHQCLKAGHSLNERDDGDEGATIFMDACLHKPINRFQTLVAMHKIGMVDIHATDNDGANALYYCEDPYRLDVCLQFGINMHTT